MTGGNRTEDQRKAIEYHINDSYVQFLVDVEDDGAE